MSGGIETVGSYVLGKGGGGARAGLHRTSDRRKDDGLLLVEVALRDEPLLQQVSQHLPCVCACE